MTTLDFAPLSQSATRDEVAAFRRSRQLGSSGTGVAMIIIVCAALLVMTAPLLFSFSSERGLPAFGIMAGFGAVVLGIMLVIRWFVSQSTWERWLRLTRFAVANGLVFATNSDMPGYPGALFGIGSARKVPENLMRLQGRFVDIGNLRYTTGSGKSKTVHNWGYLAIKLDRRLPQMILDAKSNNFIGSNLPVSFSRDQVLSLEGNFDKTFTLYCPRAYERDALYVFTPDLMVMLMDEAGAFDVEIVDDWMFLYSAGTLDLASPATLARAFRIIDTVGTKTLDRTELYADAKVIGEASSAAAPLGSRLAHNLVAPEGRRLRKGISVTTVLVGIGVAVYFVFSFLPFFTR